MFHVSLEERVGELAYDDVFDNLICHFQKTFTCIILVMSPDRIAAVIQTYYCVQTIVSQFLLHDFAINDNIKHHYFT